MVGQPIAQPAADAAQRKRRALGIDGPGRSRDDHGAAAHQVLIQRKARLLVEFLRRDHHQKVGAGIDVAVAQVFHIDAVIAGDALLDGAEAVTLRGHSGHARRRRGQHQADGARKAAGEAAQTGLQRRAEIIAVKGAGRQLHDLLLVLQGEIEVERGLIAERGDHGLKAPLIEQAPGERSIAGFGLDKLQAELAVTAVGQGLRLTADRVPVIDEHFGQQGVRRHVGAQGDRGFDLIEQLTAAAIAVQHVADSAGHVKFGVAQQDFGLAAERGLDLDKVGESQGLVFAAVLNEHIEIGVDQRRLIAIGDLKGRGPNIELFVGLLLGGSILGRIDEFHAHLAPGGDGVLRQQIAQLRRQRRQQGVGALGEITADKQRFL